MVFALTVYATKSPRQGALYNVCLVLEMAISNTRLHNVPTYSNKSRNPIVILLSYITFNYSRWKTDEWPNVDKRLATRRNEAPCRNRKVLVVVSALQIPTDISEQAKLTAAWKSEESHGLQIAVLASGSGRLIISIAVPDKVNLVR